MAVITTNLTCELKDTVKVQYLEGNLFSQDNQANVINVTVLDGGEPASISGTVTANIIRQDGGTVTATGGTITGNVASITLPAAAYIVPGIVSIAVKLTTSGVITTLAAVVANVYQSSTDTAVDPGTIIPSITALQSQIEAAVASIPADYSSLWSSLAPAFDSSASYVAGQYVTYDGGFYRFGTAHSGSWVAGDAIPVTVGGDVNALKSSVEHLHGIDIIDLIPGYYITDNVSAGVTVDLTPVASSTFNNGGYAIYNCQAGDVFIINGNGGSSARLWCFIDSSNKRLTVANSGASGSDLVITAPENAAKLIINSQTNGLCYKGITVQMLINNMTQKYGSIQTVNGDKSLFIEQGSLADGVLSEANNRIVTGYLRFSSYPVTITMNTGYRLKRFVYNDDFSYYTTANWQTEYIISSEDSYYRRFVISKTDDSAITPDDFDDAVSSGFSNAVCIIPSIQLKEITNRITETVDGYGIKLDQFNLNRNMVGSSDMVWEYQNWVFPQVISYNGIRNRLYFTFTSDAGYSGIAQYDYDTQMLTKNILKQNPSGDSDDHDLVAVLMLPSTKLICAYSGGHNTDKNMYVRIASARESIETFDNVITLPSAYSTSYAQLFYYDGKVYMFYRMSNSRWGCRIGSNYGTTWGEETVLVTNSDQMYCQFTETTTDGVLRMCCYTNPTASDTSIRMAFLHLDNMTFYDTDNTTSLGTSILRTDVRVLIDAPTGDKVNRLFNAAKTAIGKTMILYAEFSITGAGAGSDGIYYLYDDGTKVEVAQCGYALWSPKAQLGIAWVGTDKLAVARGQTGNDLIELYDYSNGSVSFNKLIVSHARQSNGVNNYRTARPMIDNNTKALVYIQGYFNPSSFEDFIMDGHGYDLLNDVDLF